MAFKVGDKAKVVDKESLLYNKTVELIEVNDEAYIFNCENPKFKLVVHKNAIQRTIEWESSPDRGEKNLSMKIDKIDNVNHPKHYQTPGGIECIDMISSTLGEEGFSNYCQGNIIKYVVRYRQKGGIESLQKARWYLDTLIRLREEIRKRETEEA
jgi:hypothetical protein